MSITDTVILLIVLQGFYPGSICQQWSFTFPTRIQALLGSCVEIPCSFTHPKNTAAFDLIWYVYDRTYYMEVFNKKKSSAENGRTSLVRNAVNSCTLRINGVTQGDNNYYYYTGISTKINSYDINGKTILLTVTDFPTEPSLRGPGIMKEGEPVIVTCSAEHTCASSPPSFQWNKAAQSIKEHHMDLGGGQWRAVSELTYDPKSLHHRSQLQCTVTYPNEKRHQKTAMLNIQYPPKNTTVLVSGGQPVKEGDDVTLSCSSHSNPGITTYKWYKGKQKTELPDQGREITVRNVSWDMDLYYCTAHNALGTGESAPLEIPVEYPPKNTTVLVSGGQPIKEGDDVTLSCSSHSNPDIDTYKWYKGKQKAELPDQGREITVRNVRWGMDQYYCTAHNALGTGESAPLEIPVEWDEDTFLLVVVLGSLSGVILLLVLLIGLYFYIRRRKYQKSAPPASPIHGTIATGIPNMTKQENIQMEEHLYANLQPKRHYNHISDLNSIIPRFSPNGDRLPLRGDTQDTLYSSPESRPQDDPDEIEYSSIRHSQQLQPKRGTQLLDPTEHAEYAAVRH
ncbi:hypothetical protein FKM82_013050 [Ascaphus truei]